MNVVSNAGPLIALGKLGHLPLLARLYGMIRIPREVYHEVVSNGLRLGAAEAPAVEALVRQAAIQVVDVAMPVSLPNWAQPLDAGEIEVLVLAQQQVTDWVLIDNEHARHAARGLGLPLKGTVGLLLAAWRHHHLSFHTFGQLMETIKRRPDLWISARLCERALEASAPRSQSACRRG